MQFSLKNIIINIHGCTLFSLHYEYTFNCLRVILFLVLVSSILYFQWDPKITTPPGLYLLIVGILKPLSTLLRVPLIDLCTTGALRFLSALNFSFLNFILILILLRRRRVSTLIPPQQSNPSSNSNQSPESQNRLSTFDLARMEQLESLAALTAVHLPVLWFSSALYYTDAASCASVLLLFCLADPLALVSVRRSEDGRTQQLLQFPILLVGALSLLLRQTNICWLLLLFLLAAARVAMHVDLCALPLPLPVREYSLAAVVRSLLLCPFRQQILFAYLLFRQCWAYITLGFWFVGFVVWNGGSVVLGDRDAHRPTPHLSQPLYLLAFAAAAVLPQLVHRLDRPAIARLVRWVRRHPALLVAALLAAAGCVRYGTLAHRYLLADNRHYPFYLWKNVLSKPALRYALVPGYLLTGALLVDALYAALRAQSNACVTRHLQQLSDEDAAADHTDTGVSGGTASTPTSTESTSAAAAGPNCANSNAPSPSCSDQLAVLTPGARLLATCCCAAVSVVLQELIECRYFIVPFVLVRLELHSLAWPEKPSAQRLKSALWPTLCELVLYLAVDAGTLYLFLYRPFRWTNDPKRLQRFMW